MPDILKFDPDSLSAKLTEYGKIHKAEFRLNSTLGGTIVLGSYGIENETLISVMIRMGRKADIVLVDSRIVSKTEVYRAELDTEHGEECIGKWINEKLNELYPN